LNKLEEQIEGINGSIPKYFSIVFEIRGFDRASTSAKLMIFHEIKEDYYLQYNQIPNQ